MFNFSGSQAYLDKLGLHIDLLRHLLIGGLIFTRLFVISIFVPFLGGRPVPGRIRISVTVALLMIFYGPVASAAPAMLPEQGGVIFGLFLKEMLVGMLIGMPLAFIFYGIQSAGNMIDNQRQLANARIFNPALGSQASLFGVFFYQLALVSFVTLGLHRMFLHGIAMSFETVPLLSVPKFVPGVNPLLEQVIRLTADTLIVCLQLSAPVLVAIFIADLILGLTNRVAPMINVFEMGFAIKGFVGTLLVFLSLELVFGQLQVWFSKTLEVIQVLLRLFTQ